MSFGAMAAWQAGLLLIGAGAAAAWLFLIKVRPPRVAVPTLLLWQRVLDQTRELTWWERVRRAVSLAATILIAALLALAVARPEPRRGPASLGRTLIVLDASWSMAARTASGETRWQRAIGQARALAAASAGEVALATTADGLVEGPTSDTALVETALDRLAPAGADQMAWPRVSGVDHVHFITDGAVARALPADVRVHSVYEPAANAAIVAFGARPSPDGQAPGEAYVQVANYADRARTVRLVVSRGTTRLADQRVDIAAGEAVSQLLPLAVSGSARLLARIETADDALEADNEAVAWIEGADAVDVTLVSDAPAALETIIRQDASLRLTTVTPAAYRPVTSGVVIFDRWVPAEAPSRPALCVEPPAAGWLGQPGTEERAARWLEAGLHPVVRGVDPLTVDVRRVRAYDGPGLVPLARSVRGTPLVSAVDTPERRVVVWTFSPADSNLAAAPGFPVLFGNTIEWLARPSYGVLRHPGPVRLPASTARVVSPDGQRVSFARAGDSVVARFAQPGLYLVEAAGSRGVVGVNVGDPDVSNLRQSSLADAPAEVVRAGGTGRPWWMWAVAAALLLVGVEWWTWQRRVTV